MKCLECVVGCSRRCYLIPNGPEQIPYSVVFVSSELSKVCRKDKQDLPVLVALLNKECTIAHVCIDNTMEL